MSSGNLCKISLQIEMLAEQIMISPVSLATLPQKERSARNGTLSRGQEDDMRQSVTCAVSSCVLLMW